MTENDREVKGCQGFTRLAVETSRNKRGRADTTKGLSRPQRKRILGEAIGLTAVIVDARGEVRASG